MRIQAMMAMILLTASLAVEAAEGSKRIWKFEDDAPGGIPKGFSPAVGEWTVVSTDGNKVLAQSAKNANTAFNLVLIDDTSAKDVDISVKIKALSGELDQGGGGSFGGRRTQRIITLPDSITKRTTSGSIKSWTASGQSRSRMQASSITTAGPISR